MAHRSDQPHPQPRDTLMIRRLASICATVALLVVCNPLPHASALSYPVVDPAALPPDGPPTPGQEMRNNGGCLFYGALPGFDPVPVPPSQAMLNLPEAWKTSRGRGVVVAVIDSGVTPQPRLPNLTPAVTTSIPPRGVWSIATDTAPRWRDSSQANKALTGSPAWPPRPRSSRSDKARRSGPLKPLQGRTPSRRRPPAM